MNTEKIDVEQLLTDFRIGNRDALQVYLKELWKDLAQRSEDKSKGINRITFSNYYNLPGIINDRLFNVFDQDKNEYLDCSEFVEGMTSLFCDNFDKQIKFVFKFYDFDRDELITQEDIRVVLSYIPINTQNKYNANKLKYEYAEYKDRIESQDELIRILEKSFESSKKMDFANFTNVIENKYSEICLYILIFLMEEKPFSTLTLVPYENISKNSGKSPENKIASKLIASPSLNSKLSPGNIIKNSPSIAKKRLEVNNKVGNSNVLSFLTGKSPISKMADDSVKSKLSQLNNKVQNADGKNPVRKQRENLKNIECLDDKKKVQVVQKVFKDDDNDYDIYNMLPVAKYEKNGETQKSNANDDSDDEEKIDVQYEGVLYKLTQTKKLKNLYFRLINKDLYYYKSKDESIHKGMHNLTGVFLEEGEKTLIEGLELYSFNVVYPKKSRIYYVQSLDEFRIWVEKIRKAIGCSNLTDKYEIKQKLGKGKFGLVRLGIHKDTDRKVAIKIMSKKEMTNQDLELVKTEIEILKVCQQPNIIRLYDIFENLDYIYIVMEFCSGGDLFSYLEQRSFKLSEQRAAEIIHKISAGIYYCHTYGIAHRDLKPENILMTDSTDIADLRILDFGLSKIIGPGESCNEPFGTLSYVAPEVLTEKPYDKAVDLWSIGIIAYLLLCGCLPFDDENSEREIARQTIHDLTPFPSSIWKKISLDAKQFVDNLLSKDPKKRMTIKEVLEHSWIQKYNKSQKVFDSRRKSKDYSSFETYTNVNSGVDTTTSNSN